LFYALLLAVANLAVLKPQSCIAMLSIPLLLPLFSSSALDQRHFFRKRLCLGLLLAALAALLCYGRYPASLSPNEGMRDGTATLIITDKKILSTPFGQRWSFRGKLKQFEGSDFYLHGGNIFFQLPVKKGISVPDAAKVYRIQTQIEASGDFQYFLRIDPNVPWYSLGSHFSVTETRFRFKQALKSIIERRISDPNAAAFLIGLATAQFDDPKIASEFGRFGLQHVLAVSGFHFAIIAGILSACLRFIVPRRSAATVLIALLCTYFLFLGPSPSIMRAWMMAMIVLFGRLFEKTPLSLNSLGVALFFILLYEPLYLLQLGFLFSFIATLGILLLFPLLNRLLMNIWKKRSLSITIGMSKVSQHAYVLLANFRQAIALTLAVHLAVVPISLYYFHQFPVLSLVFNLFYPFLVSLSLLLLVIGLLFMPLFPPLAHSIHAFNSWYTAQILDLLVNIPSSLDYKWIVPEISEIWLPIYLCGLFLFGIIFHEIMKEKNDESEDFAFI
jgi:competence protein ComEC